MTDKTEMIRDYYGSPIPQRLNEDGKTYSVLANGDTTGINFRKYKMLRDYYGSPLPYQYFDVEQMKFVEGVLGGGGTGAVDSVNGKTGNVNLTASDVGAASKAELTILSQTVTQNAQIVTEHLDESKRWFSTWKTNVQTAQSNTQTNVFWDNTWMIADTDFASVVNGDLVLNKGTYLITCSVTLSSGSDGIRLLGVGGVNDLQTNDKAMTLKVVTVDSISSDNYNLPCIINQFSGSSLNIDQASLRVYRLGDV